MASAPTSITVQVPSVGRIVHYVAYGTPGGEFPAGAHRAAMITQVDNIGLGTFDERPEVSLVVFNPTGLFFNQCVPFDPSGETPGTWHWPESVPSIEIPVVFST